MVFHLGLNQNEWPDLVHGPQNQSDLRLLRECDGEIVFGRLLLFLPSKRQSCLDFMG